MTRQTYDDCLAVLQRLPSQIPWDSIVEAMYLPVLVAVPEALARPLYDRIASTSRWRPVPALVAEMARELAGAVADVTTDCGPAQAQMYRQVEVPPRRAIAPAESGHAREAARAAIAQLRRRSGAPAKLELTPEQRAAGEAELAAAKARREAAAARDAALAVAKKAADTPARAGRVAIQVRDKMRKAA